MTQFLNLPTPCLYIPKLHCSFPVKIHPLFGKLQDDHNEWSLKMANAKTAEEKKSVRGEKFVLAACSLFPTALDSTIDNVVKYCSWFLVLDNNVDDMEVHGVNHKATLSLVERYMKIIEKIERGSDETLDHHGAKDSDSVLLSHFELLWQRFRRDMTPGQFKNFRESVMEMLDTSSHQNMRREKGIKFKTTEELLDHRKILSSVTTLINPLEYALGIELEDRVRNLPEVLEMKEVANEHICCVNDLLSFRAEYLRKDFHNLPSTICMLENVSIQEAVVETCKLVKASDERFMKLHKAITSSGSCTNELKLYVDSLGYMMSGHLEWAWQSGRYHGPDWNAPAPEQRQGIMYLAPAETSAVFKPCLL